MACDWYASRHLSDVERRYSQTEKEALALVCGLVNALKCMSSAGSLSLRRIISLWSTSIRRNRSLLARVERWVLRLQAYHLKVAYRPGKTNIADSLSRLLCGFLSNNGEDYDFVHAVVENSVPCALTTC